MEQNQSSQDMPKNEFGLTSLMYTGFQPNVHQSAVMGPAHPLEMSERSYRTNERQLHLQTLRHTQGLHAPLKLIMEERIVSRMMNRLPGLSSSHILADILTGREDEIGFEDYLNDPADSETIGNPHIMIDKKLGYL